MYLHWASLHLLGFAVSLSHAPDPPAQNAVRKMGNKPAGGFDTHDDEQVRDGHVLHSWHHEH